MLLSDQKGADMTRHLSLTDRSLIVRFVAQDFTFAYIARRLHRSPATISREIRIHRCFTDKSDLSSNDCLNYRSCLKQNLCSTKSICSSRCK